MNSRAEQVLDDAWRSLHAIDPEFAQDGFDGLSNHGPMAVEALVAMGQADAVPGFLAEYRLRLRPLALGRAIAPEARHDALGDIAQRADWIETYVERIGCEGPAAVVALEIPRLAEGVMAGALHALLRTGHALRALGRRDTPTRRTELAHALGYWAARHQPLPGRPGARAVAGRDVRATLRAMPRAVGARRSGLIFERVGVLGGLDGFVDAIETMDVDALAFDDAVTALVDASAQLYLSTAGSRFVYLHGVTGSSALRLVAPWLDAAGRRSLLMSTVQALAALHAVHAEEGSLLEAPHEAAPFDRARVARKAARSGDDHTIKLVEVLLREHAVAPRPVLTQVLRHRLL